MKEIITVTNAEYIQGYTLELTFSDGLTAEFDYWQWIEKYPFFAVLKDPEYFRRFKLDGWTVVWPNGADIAAETLHKMAVQKHALEIR
jgi:hypothetical protein